MVRSPHHGEFHGRLPALMTARGGNCVSEGEVAAPGAQSDCPSSPPQHTRPATGVASNSTVGANAPFLLGDDGRDRVRGRARSENQRERIVAALQRCNMTISPARRMMLCGLWHP
jgi:hypothetical protein